MNTTNLFKTFDKLVNIHSPSFCERELCDALKIYVKNLGLDYYEDNAGELIGGNCGNLYVYVPGNLHDDTKPIILSAHMDTVEPCLGKKAVVSNDGIITSVGNTILGADDVAGITIILEAITRILAQKIPHGPIELLFPVAEEVYGLGSDCIDYSHLKSKEAYILDLTGEIGSAANAAPTIISFSIDIQGKAAHSGFEPQNGIHAINIVAAAINKITIKGTKPDVTCNIGTISGGELSNIVPPSCKLTGEIRSLSHENAINQLEFLKSVFIKEAKIKGGTAIVNHDIKIKAYKTPLDSPVVKRFQKACLKENITCTINPTLGGSDNNNLAKNGIEGLVIACSMHDVHSTKEWSSLDELEKCTNLVISLIYCFRDQSS